MNHPPELTVQELSAWLADANRPRPVLLDVRTNAEHAICALPGSVLIPLHELEARRAEVEAFQGKSVVVYCHHGVRSLTGAAFARALGVEAASLEGGIDAWSAEIDRDVPRY